MTPVHVHVGLVTAAGASRRMGAPKALLPLACGTPLAQAQIDLLHAAGCDPVWLILGAAAATIRAQLPPVRIVTNPDWAMGRMTSIQCGLRATPQASGYVIISVDAAGMQVATLQHLLAAADAQAGSVIRPTYEGRPGYLVWISGAIAERIRNSPIPADTPLHEVLAPDMVHIPVADPAILNNANTPAEWARIRALIPTASRSRAPSAR